MSHKRLIYCAIVFLSALVVSMVFNGFAQGQCKPVGIAAIPKADRVKLWREHIRAEMKWMDKDQLAVAREALAVNPLLAKADTNALGFLDSKLGQRVIALFGAIKANFSPEQAQLFERIKSDRSLIPSVGEGTDCGCSTTWTFCGSGKSCSTEVECGQIYDCGPFGYFVCNGHCRASENARLTNGLTDLTHSLTAGKPKDGNSPNLKGPSSNFSGRGTEIHEIEHQITSTKARN